MSSFQPPDINCQPVFFRSRRRGRGIPYSRSRMGWDTLCWCRCHSKDINWLFSNGRNMFVYNLFPVHWDRGAAASQQSNDCRNASSKTFPNEEESQRFQQSFKHWGKRPLVLAKEILNRIFMDWKWSLCKRGWRIANEVACCGIAYWCWTEWKSQKLGACWSISRHYKSFWWR